MAQAERCLSLVYSGSEQFEFEDGVEITQACWSRGLQPKPRLADAEVSLPVWRELTFERRQFGRPHHIEPIRIALPEFIAGIHHHVTVEIDTALFLLLWSRGCLLRLFSRPNDDGGLGIGGCGDLLDFVDLRLQFLHLLL